MSLGVLLGANLTNVPETFRAAVARFAELAQLEAPMPPACTNCGGVTKYSALPTLMFVTPRAFTVKPGYVPACGDFIEGRPPERGCVLDPGHAGDHTDTWGGTWPNSPPITRSLAQRYDESKDVTSITAIGALHDYYCESCTRVALDALYRTGFKIGEQRVTAGMSDTEREAWRTDLGLCSSRNVPANPKAVRRECVGKLKHEGPHSDGKVEWNE